MRKAKRILVGLKSLENAVELTDLACRLGERGTSLLLVHVIELPDNTPLDAQVPNLEAEARKILRTSQRVNESTSGSPQPFDREYTNFACALRQLRTAR